MVVPNVVHRLQDSVIYFIYCCVENTVERGKFAHLCIQLGTCIAKCRCGTPASCVKTQMLKMSALALYCCKEHL